MHDIGVSSYPITFIEDLVYRTGEMPAVNQIEWSPFGHSPSMLDFCRDNEIVIQAWSPLTRASRLNDDKVATMAARYGKTPAQLLIRWNLQLGVVPVAWSMTRDSPCGRHASGGSSATPRRPTSSKGRAMPADNSG